MNDRQWPPVDRNDNCTFAVSVDRDAAKITLDGPAAGPAGGASLTPVSGVEMVFDRAIGFLSHVTVDAGEPCGPVVPGEPALAYLGRVLGDRVAAVVRQSPFGKVPPVAPQPDPAAMAALSRLARLQSAWRTTPVPCSPLWALEAADLARPGQRPPVRTGLALSSALMAQFGPAATPAGGKISSWLDPALVPPRVFRYGLSPDSDLDIHVHDGEDRPIIVEAMLAVGADRSALASCQVRLVDSDARCVLGLSPFRADGMSARAEFPAPAVAGSLWAEVVDDERRPVRGTQLRRMRRALRWADAALRAASRPAGLDPDRTDEQWARLAALAWDRCRVDWAAAGDVGRATAAARLARHPIQWTRAYLAEATSDPAALR